MVNLRAATAKSSRSDERWAGSGGSKFTGRVFDPGVKAHGINGPELLR